MTGSEPEAYGGKQWLLIGEEDGAGCVHIMYVG